MKKEMTREQVIDLLYYLGASKVVNKEGKSDIQFTCTVHGESNPSAGFNLDKMCFNCFSCHASGGLEWLVLKSLPDEFKSIYEVDKFIKERYGVDLSSVDMSQIKELRRYGENKNTTTYEKYEKKVLPKSFLAPFKSGKETYKYFYDRGFTKETVTKFNIGRDLVNKTVTVPVYYDNEQELIEIVKGSSSPLEDVKKLYLDEFEEARLEYNSKQSRPSRMIDNYFNNVSNNEKKDLACEIILELGDKEY